MNKPLLNVDVDSDKLQPISDIVNAEKKLTIPLSNSCNKSQIIQKVSNSEEIIDEEVLESLPAAARYLKDKRIVFNSFLENEEPNIMKMERKRFHDVLLLLEKKRRLENSESILLQRRSEFVSPKEFNGNLLDSRVQRRTTTLKNFPFALSTKIVEQESCENLDEHEINYDTIPEVTIKDDLAKRLQLFEEGKIKPVDLEKRVGTDMRTQIQKYGRNAGERTIGKGSYYEEETEIIKEEDILSDSATDCSMPASNVGCRRCGALLHCMDPGLPGFLPKDEFVNATETALQSTSCKQCTALAIHNTSLQVRVSTGSYLQLLRPIKTKLSLLLLLVDITDAPCSIHPAMMQVIARGQPVILVGNKVDLVPLDHKHTMEHLETSLARVVRSTPLVAANIVQTCLVSGHTGFGIGNLIASVHYHWQGRGDIYLLGPTNVGKTTLFNALLRSDLCRSNKNLPLSSEEWPGTSVNMFKFPMVGTSGRKLFLEADRLIAAELEAAQRYYPTHGSPLLSLASRQPSSLTVTEDGMEDEREVKWCYDTPGALQPDQLLELLTHEELQLVQPKKPIVPETFCLRLGQSLLLGGLARLDVVRLHHTEPSSIGRQKWDIVKVTVFRSSALPVTVIPTNKASSFYREYLGTEVLGVPCGPPDRLEQWPELKHKEFSAKGVERGLAAADVVLSSAGWVSLCMSPNTVCDVHAWTPEGRGAHLRQPPFLPYSVTRRGPRNRNTIRYGDHTPYVQQLPYTDMTTFKTRERDHNYDTLMSEKMPF